MLGLSVIQSLRKRSASHPFPVTAQFVTRPTKHLCCLHKRGLYCRLVPLSYQILAIVTLWIKILYVCWQLLDSEGASRGWSRGCGNIPHNTVTFKINFNQIPISSFINARLAISSACSFVLNGGKSSCPVNPVCTMGQSRDDNRNTACSSSLFPKLFNPPTETKV